METKHVVLHKCNHVKEEEKHSFFLFSMGEAGREIFNTSFWPKVTSEDDQPTEEDDISVPALFKNLEDYCKPHGNLIVERHIFNTRKQNPSESIDQYVTKLKTLAVSCEYGELTDDLITSQLVAGIQSEKVRDRRLQEGSERTLKKTIDICRSNEIAERQMKLLSGDLEVDAINKGGNKHGEQTCRNYRLSISS